MRIVFKLALSAFILQLSAGCQRSREQELFVGTWVGTRSGAPYLLQVRTDGNLTELFPGPGGVFTEDFQYEWRSGRLWLEGYKKQEGPGTVRVTEDKLSLEFPSSVVRDDPLKLELTRTTAFDPAIRSRELPRLWRPSAALARVIEDAPRRRSEAVSRFWSYVKKNGLMDRTTQIVRADEKLRVFLGKEKAPATEVDRLLDSALTLELDPLLAEENALFEDLRRPSPRLASLIGTSEGTAAGLLARLEAYRRSHGRAGTPWKPDSRLKGLLAGGSYHLDDLPLIVLDLSEPRTAHPEAEQRIRRRLLATRRSFAPSDGPPVTEMDLEEAARSHSLPPDAQTVPDND